MTATLIPAPVDELVSGALDNLPEHLLDAIADVPVIVTDNGADPTAYGLANGDGIAPGLLPDRIVLYREPLERDFGDDPVVLLDVIESELRQQITALGRH